MGKRRELHPREAIGDYRTFFTTPWMRRLLSRGYYSPRLCLSIAYFFKFFEVLFNVVGLHFDFLIFLCKLLYKNLIVIRLIVKKACRLRIKHWDTPSSVPGENARC